MITDNSFDSDFCIQNKLGFSEIYILSEIYGWLFSDNPPETIFMNNEKYFYISQSYFYEKHKSICSFRTMQRIFKKIKDIGIIKDNKVIGRNRKNYVSFNYDVISNSLDHEEINRTKINLEWIKNKEENEVLFTDEEMGIKPKKYSKEAENTVIEILNNNKDVFTTRVPKDLNNPTKTFSKSCIIINDIYNGKFTNPRLYYISPDFNKGKQFNVDGWNEKINAVKGNWNKVKELLNNCIKNFKLMKDKDRMPFKKDYLQSNFDKWLYDDYTFGSVNATSQFIQSINEPMYTMEKLSEDKADKIFDTLGTTAKKGGNKLFELNTNMASGRFWELVSKMVEWGKCLIHYDENVHCWIEKAGEIPGLFADYLSEHNINVNLSTLDIEKAVSCNSPWTWFIQEVSNKHGLNKDVVTCVSENDFKNNYEIPVF